MVFSSRDARSPGRVRQGGTMERSLYPMEWARLWLEDIGAPVPSEGLSRRLMVDALYDGGWAALEATALADYDAGCR